MEETEKIKLAENNKDIPTEVIRQDIADTQAEIIQMSRELRGYELIGDRMSQFRADARRNGIKEREDFVEKLQIILEVRNK